MQMKILGFTAALCTALGCAAAPSGTWADPLPSWNDGSTKAALVAFVERVTDEGSDGFVPPPERVAVFDNDGTLWSEQPMYFQALWSLARVQELAPNHPEWRDTEPFKSALAGDLAGVMAGGKEGLLKLVAATHADVTAEEFRASVRGWLATAKHPTTGRPMTGMVYQPMLELLDYLRANGFKAFIVTGGGIDFVRVFAEEAYGVPPEQVVGSQLDARFELRDGVPTIVKEAELVLIDDKEGKPVGIYRHIGRRPILAAGNSDGDLQMLQDTTLPRGADDVTPRLGLLVHHTDGEREFAYDRQSSVGKLDQALDESGERGWLLVDMKADWSRVFPAEGE